MASIAELNIKMGADLSSLRRELNAAERLLRGTGERLTNMGRELSMNVSAPIVALGALAIKTAGEFESLKLAMVTTMTDSGKSIAAAGLEVEALRKAAMAPGLDFEQAIRGSVRLQNIGMTAEGARATIVELANAIAMSGGSADDLDGVTKQFAQMAAKGRIMQEDLSIIQERMPVLSRVMKEAFGTVSAEALRDKGVSATQFIDVITSRLGELQRVEGGLSNTFVNMGSAVKQFAVTIGTELAASLNIKGLGESFAATLDSWAYKFRAMDASTKEWIIKLGLMVVAAGPVLLALGAMAKAGAMLQVAFLASKAAALEVGAALGRMVVFLGEVRKAFLALNMTAQIGILGVLALAITGAAMAFNAFSGQMSTAEKVAASLNDVNREAGNLIATEKVKAEQLIGVLKNENATRQEKARAIDLLKRISPEHFGRLDLEKLKTEELDKALGGYINKLMQAAKAQAAMQKMVEIEKQILDLQGSKRGALGYWEKMSAGMAGMSEKMGLDRINNQIEAQIAPLEAQKKALAEIAAANTEVETTTKRWQDATVQAATLSKAEIAKMKREMEKSAEEVSDITDRLMSIADGRGFEAKAPGMLPGLAAPTSLQSIAPDAAPDPTAFADSLKPMGDAYMSFSAKLGVANTAMQDGIKGFGDTFAAVAALVEQNGTIMMQVSMGVADAMQQYAQKGGASLKELAMVAVGAAAKIIRANIMEGVSRVVSGALKSVPFPFNLAVAGAAGAAAGTLFNMALSKIGVPALAEGGLAKRPTLAMVGDNKNAARDPEVIAPLSKLRGMLAMDNQGGGGMLTASLHMDQIMFMVERAMQRRERARG